MSSSIFTNTIDMPSVRERKVTPRFTLALKLGGLEVGKEVKERWVGVDYKGNHYYDAIITSMDADQQTCALVFPVRMVPYPNWDTDTDCPMWSILPRCTSPVPTPTVSPCVAA